MPKWVDDPDLWPLLRDGTACWTCAAGVPKGIVVAESPVTWITTRREASCRGYLCIYSKRHVVEPHELTPQEMTTFFADAMTAARAIDALFDPVKINYEIHGNTNPHLHLHVFPRYVGDPFESGSIDGSNGQVTHSDAEIDQIRNAVVVAARGGVRSS